MISGENINYAVKNLSKRKLRSGLTIVSIFVGISTIFIFISFGLGLFQYIDKLSSEVGVDKLTVQPRGIGAPGADENFQLKEKDLREFQRTRGITEATGMAFSIAEAKSHDERLYTFIIGIDTENKEELALAYEYFTVDPIKGRQLEKGDSGRVTLGYNYMFPDKIFRKPLDIGDKIEVNGFDLKIVGFYEEIGNPGDDANIYVDFDTYKKVTGKDEISYALLAGRVEDVDRIEEIRLRAKKNIRKARGLEEGKEDFFIQSTEQMIESFSGALDIVVGFIVLIAVISVFVSAINTANTMFTSILERTKEIGILKAIGARNSEIMYLFIFESVILGFIAGVIGILVGFGLSYVGGLILRSLGWGFLKPSFHWLLFIGLMAFATLVGGISGIIPAFNASRQNPVDSLRYE